MISGSRKISLGKGMEKCFSILAWKVQWAEEPGGAIAPWGPKESGVADVHTS